MAPQAQPAAGVAIAEKGTHFPFIKTELASRFFRLLGGSRCGALSLLQKPLHYRGGAQKIFLFILFRSGAVAFPGPRPNGLRIRALHVSIVFWGWGRAAARARETR
jgi:hypothetical protein